MRIVRPALHRPWLPAVGPGVAYAMNVHKVLIVLGALSLLTAACGMGASTSSTSSRSADVAPAAPAQTGAAAQSTGASTVKPGAGPADVSQQYVDLQARLRNAESQRDVMLTLMGQAKSVSDTVQIQNQLGQVTGQIEQLKGQIDYLNHSTTFATLAVSIREAAAGPRDEWGLQTAVYQAAHNIVAVLAVLIVILGTLLPVLLVGAAVGGGAWRLW